MQEALRVVIGYYLKNREKPRELHIHKKSILKKASSDLNILLKKSIQVQVSSFTLLIF